MRVKLKNHDIKAISFVLGQNESSFDDEMSHLTPIKLNILKQNLGIKRHYVSDNDIYATDLATKSINALLEAKIIQKSDIDALIIISHTPDFLMPSNSHIVHKNLNLLSKTLCFDMTAFCSGFIQGLFQAFLMLDNKNFKNVILCSVSVKSKIINRSDKLTFSTISDSTSAVLISKSKEQKTAYFASEIFSDECLNETKPIGAYKSSQNKFLNLDNDKFFKIVFQNYPKFFDEFCKFCERQTDTFIFHAPSRFFYDKFLQTLKLDENLCFNKALKEIANTDINSVVANIIKLANNRGGVQSLFLGSFGTGIVLNGINILINFDSLKILKNTKF